MSASGASGGNPLDRPLFVEAMRVTKLQSGWVLNAMGETYACATPAALAATVKRLALRLEALAQAVISPAVGDHPPVISLLPDVDAASALGGLAGTVPAVDGDAGIRPEPIPAGGEELTASEWTSAPQLSPEESLAAQRENLATIVEAYSLGSLTDEQFIAGANRYCPDLDQREIMDALEETERRVMDGATITQDTTKGKNNGATVRDEAGDKPADSRRRNGRVQVRKGSRPRGGAS